LIGYDALNSYGSASYYAQKMLTHNHGDTTVDASLDGLVSSAQTNFFYSVTRDSKDGTVYLAVVNINDTPKTLHIDLKGVTSVAANGQATVLTSGALADTNSIAEPTKVAPVTTPESGLSASFTRVFPPQSFTILNIPAK
jgi:alpha-N-arabinofuranosidase